MSELSQITYSDADQGLRLSCYADTFVYHKASGSERNLVAMRFGGYPEQVKAMADVLRKGAGVEAVIENHSIILRAQHNAYKRSVTHDGIYAEGTMLALDDESGEMEEDEQMEVENPKAKRKMYIFCDEGDTNSLYAELDKKTSIPLIPEFKDYILEECFKQRILVQLEVPEFIETEGERYIFENVLLKYISKEPVHVGDTMMQQISFICIAPAASISAGRRIPWKNGPLTVIHIL
jgi:hypothetical protein